MFTGPLFQIKQYFTKYCPTPWISKLLRSFEIHWVRQYLVNPKSLAGIVDVTIYKTMPISHYQVSGMANCPNSILIQQYLYCQYYVIIDCVLLWRFVCRSFTDLIDYHTVYKLSFHQQDEYCNSYINLKNAENKGQSYCQTSNISDTKSKNLNVSRRLEVVFPQSIEARCVLSRE